MLQVSLARLQQGHRTIPYPPQEPALSDRFRGLPLVDAAKCVLVSFDSTMRSNISVGLPIDLVCYEADSLRVGVRERITEGDHYFSMIHRQWGEGLRRVFAELPDPQWV